MITPSSGPELSLPSPRSRGLEKKKIKNQKLLGTAQGTARRCSYESSSGGSVMRFGGWAYYAWLRHRRLDACDRRGRLRALLMSCAAPSLAHLWGHATSSSGRVAGRIGEMG